MFTFSVKKYYDRPAPQSSCQFYRGNHCSGSFAFQAGDLIATGVSVQPARHITRMGEAAKILFMPFQTSFNLTFTPRPPNLSA
jgi:hypothetical protein